jgi:RimJ/RimL family protein N-acetyltransferase
MGHCTVDLDTATIHRVGAYWLAWEGRDPSRGYVSIVRLGADRFVTAPPELRARVESADPSNPDDLIQVLSDHAVARSGEARLAYTDRRSFRPRATSLVVAVDADDARLARLRDSADPDEWGESMSHDDRAHISGIVEDSDLVAIAAHHNWDDALGHVAVFTARSARSRGLATTVASATVEQAMTDGLVPQWRVRVGNDASRRVAEKLGFVELGRQIYGTFDVDR